MECRRTKLLNDLATEGEFAARVDVRFPYADPLSCTALIGEARSISLNAVFLVLEEICRAPKSASVTAERQRRLVAEWSASVEHELKDPILACASALIDRDPLDWRRAVAVMEQVAPYQSQGAALSIAYFAGDSDTNEGDAALEDTYNRIMKTWAAIRGSE